MLWIEGNEKEQISDMVYINKEIKLDLQNEQRAMYPTGSCKE